MSDLQGAAFTSAMGASALAQQGLILLDSSDNCYVLSRAVSRGDVIDVGGTDWNVTVSLPPGHKIARWPIDEGVVVTKFGVPIGRAARSITQFEHIHLHNLTSQYIPTYERGAPHARTGGSGDG